MSLEIIQTESCGRGVKTSKFIQEGEIVEVCPVILLPINIYSTKNKNLCKSDVVGQLSRYWFSWKKSNTQVIALGFGSLYNHSTNPNMKVTPNFDNGTITFTALRDIQANEELVFDYRYDPNKVKRHTEIIEIINELEKQE